MSTYTKTGSYALQLANSHAFDGQSPSLLENNKSDNMMSYLPKITIRRVFFMSLWLFIQAIIVAYYTSKAKETTTAMDGFNRGVEILIMFNLSAIFLFMSPILMNILRSTFVTRFLTIEKNVHAHKFIGYILIVSIIIHAITHYYKFHQLEQQTKGKLTFMMLAFHKKTGIIGHSMLAVVTVMMAAAIPPVRRKMFEVFYLLHHLYIILIVLLFFHVAKPTLHYFLLGPGCIYAMDRLYRFVRSRTNRPQILSVIQHPSNVIELRFAKAGMNVKVGQFIYLNIPSISWFQWHPFTLTSAPEDDELSVHIYVAGGWTNKLVEMFKQSAVDMPKRIDIVHHSVPTPARVQRKQPDLIDLHRSNSNPTSALYTPRRIREQPFDNGSERTLPAGMDYYASATNHANMDSILRRNKALPAAPRYYGSLPTILVDGPYGAPTQHVFDYENIMLIAGGIGITPMSSVLKSLYYQLTGPAHRRKVKKVYFFWICRDIKSLEWFRDLLAALDSEDIGNILEIRTYLTGQLSMDHIRNISLNQDSGGPDAITGLYRSPTYYGRPNFDKIFENVGMRNPDTDIGVFFCGSKTLGQNIRGARKKWNKELDHRNTKFHYHEEKSG